MAKSEVRGVKVDMSQVETNNATKTLHDSYTELMQIDSPEVLRATVVEIVTAQGGISSSNLRKFKFELQKQGQNLIKLQTYITNFMLKGCRLGVVYTGQR